jgi:glutamine synthetase
MNRKALQESVRELGARYVECALSDLSSVARGKVVDAGEFLAQAGCRLSSVVFGLGLTGNNPPGMFGPILPAAYPDMNLLADPQTLVAIPGRPGHASVLCEPQGPITGTKYAAPYDASLLSPRVALRRVLARLEASGFTALAAPELEFFLLARRPGAPGAFDAAGVRGEPARESACEVFSLERCGHFGEWFDELFAACEVQRIPVSGYVHESALSQFEVNFHPAAPLAQADAVFRFKGLARRIAAKHGFLATFAAKPFLDQPGTGMHWHFSLQAGGTNAFSTAAGGDDARLGHFIGGLQAHAQAAMALFAPYDLSWDRIRLADASPSNASWGADDRASAFRIPVSSASARRIENRLPGADSNPYLVCAATLGLGLAGIEGAIEATPAAAPAPALPKSLAGALTHLEADPALRSILGEVLIDAFCAHKRGETQVRSAHADPRNDWDLVHLVELS